MRLSSHIITRSASARGGALTPMSFSAARQNTRLLGIAET